MDLARSNGTIVRPHESWAPKRCYSTSKLFSALKRYNSNSKRTSTLKRYQFACSNASIIFVNQLWAINRYHSTWQLKEKQHFHIPRVQHLMQYNVFQCRGTHKAKEIQRAQISKVENLRKCIISKHRGTIFVVERPGATEGLVAP